MFLMFLPPELKIPPNVPFRLPPLPATHLPFKTRGAVTSSRRLLLSVRRAPNYPARTAIRALLALYWGHLCVCLQSNFVAMQWAEKGD